MKIRRACSEDLRAITAVDPLSTSRRKELLKEAIEGGAVHLLHVRGELFAYAILRRSFFERFFLELLFVHPAHRRKGYGRRLLEGMEDIARKRGELWTSTNQSNRPMQRLLNSHGYRRTGKIVGLDEGDPELFFVKTLAPKP